MASVVYILCSLTAFGCAVLLLRAFARTRSRLLLWSGLCFAGLTVSNVLVIVDLMVVPQVSLLALRSVVSLASVSVLVVGLVWESR